jgi:ABC-2 type transport system ATP-binding protein
MNVVEANELRVELGENEILHKLNVVVRAGTITGLIGPSGSGKTTIMRSIVGVQKYSGRLTVLGEAAGSKSLRPKIGYVTQSPAVYGDLTIAQNITYFATIAGATKAQAKEVIKKVRLNSLANQLVGSLSGGQRARVSLAVALLGDPELLVLDEPTVGLDPILRAELWAEFAELARQGKSLLISSHVMDEADRCEELILVRDGKILWNDTRSNLLKQTKSRSVGDAFVTMIGSKK